MKTITLLLAMLFTTTNPALIFDFDKEVSLQNWQVVDDVVMGGRSSGKFTLNDDGHGVFSGKVSLENNGGFSSVRYDFPEKKSVKGFTKVIITLKGDGKDYQFRIKAKSNDYYSYIAAFKTSGEWEKVEISLAEMYPSFRGRTLDMPNFESDFIEELRFLIGNKKPQSFELIIDKIELG
ncbi:MAG: CIA30 family protein [Spirosomaceae bacterium]|nr:CIA30 family protein [Spirosomataceae bacterium]